MGLLKYFLPWSRHTFPLKNGSLLCFLATSLESNWLFYIVAFVLGPLNMNNWLGFCFQRFCIQKLALIYVMSIWRKYICIWTTMRLHLPWNKGLSIAPSHDLVFSYHKNWNKYVEQIWIKKTQWKIQVVGFNLITSRILHR